MAAPRMRRPKGSRGRRPLRQRAAAPKAARRAGRVRIAVLHGPNLNLLGTREVDIYGSETLAESETELGRRASEKGGELRSAQTNHEGELVALIQLAKN